MVQNQLESSSGHVRKLRGPENAGKSHTEAVYSMGDMGESVKRVKNLSVLESLVHLLSTW